MSMGVGENLPEHPSSLCVQVFGDLENVTCFLQASVSSSCEIEVRSLVV